MRKITFLVLSLTLLAAGTLFANGQQDKEKEIVLKWPSIWVGEDSKAGAVAELVDQFNADNAGKIRVEVEAQPDYDGYEQKIRTSIAAGIVPDIFTMKLNPTTKAYYESPLLMDFSKELNGGWGKDFNAGTVAQATVDGMVKSLPYEVAITPVWYNMDLFKKAGVSKYPQTYAEFLDAAAKLKAAGFIPTSQMTGGSNAWTSMLWYSHFLASFGGPDVYANPFGTDAYVKAAEVLLAMYSDGNTSIDAIGGDAGVSGGHYLAGESAMFINGPWYIGRVKSEAPAVYSATEVGPAPAAGNNKGAMVGFLQTNFAAAANADDPEKAAAAVKFIKWMTKSENVAKISAASGAMFAVKYDSSSITDELMGKFINASNDASFTIPHLEGVVTSDVITEFGQALGKMALGEATPEEFVEMLKKVQDQ
ncbi:ABC transporter substrate-binding protein [Spirochaeta isovalerica]|uniref:Raffinose/stachyose/melibiose transport system substrate-binding protein n=1 Tax=Spirochaeta isovalerica TaxID=150 RepID=A0A841RG01_9SPIO|nr:extracellular solute-binding protein [Spirochaeta isovalerica]MBB6482516.1 raffinose/stachyose/melibiose transport system substrate-binding protein [Spirochaeta isovalerica]